MALTKVTNDMLESVSSSQISDADNDTKIQVEKSADEDIIRMDVAGAEAFKLNADGILDLVKQPSVHVNFTTKTQSITSGFEKLEFDNEQHDNNSDFDSSTNYRFTCPVDGIYLVAAQALFRSAQDTHSLEMAIYINGSQSKVTKYHASKTYHVTPPIIGIFDLNANDYIEIYAASSNGSVTMSDGNSNAQTDMSFMVHKLA